ncbi:MAG: MerC domain-containing protein [Algiphilus sp.]
MTAPNASMPLRNAPIDRLAITLSGVCAVHCVLVVAAITAIPIWGLGWLTAPHFHEWFLAAALAPSAFALVSGYQRHRNRVVVALGVLALGLMALAIALSTLEAVSPQGESFITLSGAGLLAFAHWRNLRLGRCGHAAH